MPFPFSVFLFSYVIWQAQLEGAFTYNPFEIRSVRSSSERESGALHMKALVRLDGT